MSASRPKLGKPLVIEEFGYPRGEGSYDPSATTAFKDRCYRQIYGAVEADVARGGPIAGTNFWAWSGEGRAAHADHRFVPGDKSWLGDPPHAQAARLVRRVRWRADVVMPSECWISGIAGGDHRLHERVWRARRARARRGSFRDCGGRRLRVARGGLGGSGCGLVRILAATDNP